MIVAVMVAAMGPSSELPRYVPVAPYDHTGFNEVSVASESVVAGQATTALRGLSDRGFWCLEPRRNDLAVQIVCRSPEHDVQVDLIAAPDGDILYTGIDLRADSRGAASHEPADRLLQVLDASLLQVWPQDRMAVLDLVEKARPTIRFGAEVPPRDPEMPYSTNDEHTDTARWSLRATHGGDPITLQVRTSRFRQEDQHWPTGGQHYATSLDAAVSELTAIGFTCPTSGEFCYRLPDVQSVRFEQRDGQIVAVRLILRTSSDDGDRRTDASGRWVQAGLPFLTPATRDAVSQVVDEHRIAQTSWRGVVEGTPVEIRVVPGASSLPGDRPARDLDVTIGIPLLDVE